MHRGAALTLYDTVVASDWVDYNGHMNDAAYALVFSRATDALMDRIGLDAAARKSSGRTLYTLQVMLHYLQEASEGAPLFVACQLLEHDDKRMRIWLEMRAGRDGAGARRERATVALDRQERRREGGAVARRDQSGARRARQSPRRPRRSQAGGQRGRAEAGLRKTPSLSSRELRDYGDSFLNPFWVGVATR